MKNKLYHAGIRGTVSRSSLADANEKRDWRIDGPIYFTPNEALAQPTGLFRAFLKGFSRFVSKAFSIFVTDSRPAGESRLSVDINLARITGIIYGKN
jgi:hypothetical protein